MARIQRVVDQTAQMLRRASSCWRRYSTRVMRLAGACSSARHAQRKTAAAQRRVARTCIRPPLVACLLRDPRQTSFFIVYDMSTCSTEKRCRATRSRKAGLVFPVGRIHRHLKRATQAARVTAGAAVYLTAVLEYMATEIVELAGHAVRDTKLNRVRPRHVMLAIRNDTEFNPMLADVIIAQGGVPPNIVAILLPKRQQPDYIQRRGQRMLARIREEARMREVYAEQQHARRVAEAARRAMGASHA